MQSLAYVEIGMGNGGIVLNVSEGGISVQAAGVLDAGERVTMRLQIPRVRKRLEVSGEIVWLSASKKEAGLRFIDLPETALAQIRQWIKREASPEYFEDENDPLLYDEPVPAGAVASETRIHGQLDATAIAATEIQGFAPEPDFEEATEVFEEQEAAGIESIEAPQKHEAATEAVYGEKRTTETEAGTSREPVRNDEAAREAELIQAFTPPGVPLDRRPHAPFSAMSAMSEPSRGTQNFTNTAQLLREFRNPLADPMPTWEAEPSPGKKDIKHQWQTGWFLAALVLLLALISFIAGMAVRRGALVGVLGDQEGGLIPKSAPAPDPSHPSAASASFGAPRDINVDPAKPLSIEIVDMADRHWDIPATTGANRPDAKGAGLAAGTLPANPATAPEAAPLAQSASRPARTLSPGAGPSEPPTAGKTAAPLVLRLPETPISASGSVAIGSQRSVSVPSSLEATKSGKNLQVGQLINLVEPAYPAEAVQQRIEGIVKLHAVIGADGVIESLAQVSGPQPLVNASMAAVRNWRYGPTRMNGQAVETQEDISFVFRLPN